MFRQPTHWEMCLARVKQESRVMHERAAKGEINASCIEGILRTFVEQPAYHKEWRADLVRLAMEDYA